MGMHLSFISRFFAVIVFFCATLCYAALAESELELLEPFSPSKFSESDKKIIQAGLVLSGHYDGLIDGEWGSDTARALADYTNTEFSDSPQIWHAAMLGLEYMAAVEDFGWEMRYNSSIGLSFLVPIKRITINDKSEHFENYSVSETSLGISTNSSVSRRMQNIHEFALSSETSKKNLYTVRKEAGWVTAFYRRGGGRVYVRSVSRGKNWGTIYLSADEADVPSLRLMAASISRDAGAQISFRESSRLLAHIGVLIEVISSEGKRAEGSFGGEFPRQSTRERPEYRDEEIGTLSTGTGFYVSDEGHILTNAHVVESCDNVFIDSRQLKLIDTATAFDLALLLDPAPPKNQRVASFAADSAKLNADITVVGYPLHDLLGGVNVTRGEISALKGIGGDEITYQISAPIQPGNSGGPTLNNNGAVIGVVVSKLREEVVAASGGGIPQNINFAIKAEAAKQYLDSNRVEYATIEREDRLSAEEVAERALDFTVLLECR